MSQLRAGAAVGLAVGLAAHQRRLSEGDCLGDLDGSGVVDVEDLLIVIGAWT